MLERVESVVLPARGAQNATDLLRARMKIRDWARRVFGGLKDGIHLPTQAEKELTLVIPLRRAVVAAAEEHLGLPLVARHEHSSRHL